MTFNPSNGWGMMLLMSLDSVSLSWAGFVPDKDHVLHRGVSDTAAPMSL